MFTREDYINGNCTHREYYADILRDTDIPVSIVDNISLDDSITSWDSIAYSLLSIPTNIKKAMEKRGDYPTLAGVVCLLKELKRQTIGD